ncbi:MAG: hypothetical protein QXI16_06260 [Sulfolobaceae archaeon]
MEIKLLNVYKGISKKNDKPYYVAQILIGRFVKKVFLYESEYNELIKLLERGE